MKVLLVVCFLTIIFLSQGWGKHYLIKTGGDDHDYQPDESGLDFEKEDDQLGLDLKTADAETLIYTAFNDDALDQFEKFPEETKEMIIEDVNKILDNARKGNGGGDYSLDWLGPIVQGIGGWFVGGENPISGLLSMIFPNQTPL